MQKLITNGIGDSAFVIGHCIKVDSTHFFPFRQMANTIDRRSSFHPDDARDLLLLVESQFILAQRKFLRTTYAVCVQRVKTTHLEFIPHILILKLKLDDNNEPTQLLGVFVPIPSDAPLRNTQLKFLTKIIHIVFDRLHPFVDWLARHLRKLHKTIAVNTVAENYQYNGYQISPSQYRMKQLQHNTEIQLTRRQAVFIKLLLTTRDANGKPDIVDRELTRRIVFGGDPTSTQYDNDIDRMVMLFRNILGRSAIETIRGIGHQFNSEVCHLDSAP